MNKKATIAIVFLIAFCVMPIVSAFSQTLTVAQGWSPSYIVKLRQGDHVTLNVTVMWDTNNSNVRSQCINLLIKNQNNDIFGEYNITFRENLGTQVYSFDAPVKGDYAFDFKDVSSVPSTDEKKVVISYNITHSASGEPLSSGTIIGLVVITAILLTFIGYILFNSFLKPKILPKIDSKYDGMLVKRTSEIASIKESRNISSESQKSEIILRCNNAWLSQSQLYCNRTFYQVSEMTKAWVDYRDYLSVQFIDGMTISCKLMPDRAAIEAINKFASFNQQTADSAFKAFMHTRTEEWVETINALVTKRIQLETVVCEHCGAKNKIADAKCFNCGAILH